MNNPKNAALHKPALKRFYKTAAVAQADDGWQVLLDNKPIRTPAKELLVLPTQKLAEAVAAEWDRQGETVELDGMYHMQFSCAAVDYTQGYRSDVEAETHDYITTDLLCYRAMEPHDLVQQQNTLWNPWVDWAEKRYGIRLVLVAGIMPAPQSGETLEAMEKYIAGLDDFALTAVWLLAKHTGSLLLALAVWEKALSTEDAFKASRLEETHQNAQWGEDEEALQRRESAAAEMAALGEFIALIQ